jgi:hypothetical protein
LETQESNMQKNEFAVTPGKPPVRVTQAELQEVIDLQNRVEILAAGIRRRLEAGAEFERGPLGASAWGCDPLGELGIGDATEADGFGILNIGPADRHIKVRNQHPEVSAQVWA